jgi:hypothetical protein
MLFKDNFDKGIVSSPSPSRSLFSCFFPLLPNPLSIPLMDLVTIDATSFLVGRHGKSEEVHFCM